MGTGALTDKKKEKKKLTGFRVGEGTLANKFLGSPSGADGPSSRPYELPFIRKRTLGVALSTRGSGYAAPPSVAMQLHSSRSADVLQYCLPRATRPIDGLVTRM